MSISFVPLILQCRLTIANKASFHTSSIALGRPFKKRDGYKVVHATQQPAQKAGIDFTSLNLKYEIKEIPKFVVQKHCWSPKPEVPPALPFMVDRTDIGLSLPVYTDFKHGRTKVVTILRKIRGDVNVLQQELEKVVGKPVTVRPGKLVVDGNYHRRLKIWLTGLGF